MLIINENDLQKNSDFGKKLAKLTVAYWEGDIKNIKKFLEKRSVDRDGISCMSRPQKIKMQFLLF
jgi:hypothetical protein